MKKILTLLLTLCLLLGLMPTQALAYVGDIQPSTGSTVETQTVGDTFVLENEYIRVTLNRQDGSVTTSPAVISDNTGKQKPFCEFITYQGYAYNIREIVHPANLRLKSAAFVNRTPNGDATAIKAEYVLTVNLSGRNLTATTAVYYELVQCKENESSKGDWGVLTSVDNIRLNNSRDDFFDSLNSDVGVRWGYTLDAFTGMGHANATDSPAIKMSRTVYNTETNKEISTESSVLTSQVENLSTWQTFKQGKDFCYNYITEVYVDGYAWANTFVGLSSYYKDKTIKAYLPHTVSVTPSGNPANTRVECRNDVGYYFSDEGNYPGKVGFLWGFRGLIKDTDSVPSKPDEVKISINAKRLAAFANGNVGVTVEYIADDAALERLKKQYGNPVALISGDYESNGADFTFTGGAAMLSPSVTATWGSGGKLVIHKNGRIEHSGVSLNAPSFKFYQPNNGKGKELKISLTEKGFTFEIDPNKNNAIVYVDIPYTTVKLEKATADATGNLVLGGEIGFQTVFDGAKFSLQKLGYGLNENKEFKVNGVHATGIFDTAKTLSLELAKVKGEVNTFKGEESYAFELELNAFDLFETEAELELVRSKKDGSLLPNTLYFYVAASPGIPLIPPVPIGQLNGGGAGFKDLAATVNGDYYGIPPIKLRGTLKGTYLHLIEGKGDVVIGPSEISLTASDVGIVGTNASIIDSFGYSLKLNGQDRTYNGTTYKGIYLAGSEALELNLPSTEIDVFILDTSIELGAFGGTGTKNNTKHLYLGVGANAVVKSEVQVPSDVPVIGGWKLGSWDVDLIVGGQTEFPIENASVDEGMKQAFRNIDLYLGAMTGVYAGIIDARLWVLVPNIVETNFRKGGGWDIETKWFGKLPEWDWTQKGVEPVVQSVMQENGGRAVPVLLAAEPPVLKNGSSGNTKTFVVNAGEDETPYILLAFDNTVTEEEIKDNLFVTKQSSTNSLDIHWLTYNTVDGEKGKINTDKDINAATDIIKNNDGKDYRIAILRLKDEGTYEVNTGSLALAAGKSKGFAVTPFEELVLDLNNNQVSGKIKYAEENTKYVLRTYFANKEGGADYLIDEREVVSTESITVSIPTQGALVPTGSYYVTSFLMTEKSVESTNESGEKETLTGLVAIDNKKFSNRISYTNTKQPSAPQSVTLALAGNEVMKANWTAVDGAAGYAVTIYQKDDDDKWIDTGFGYDLKKSEDGQPQVTSIDMALTVGGAETKESKNLSAGQTYKVGVRAYKLDTESEGAKYYSAESDSSGVYLPEYTPLNLNLSVNDAECTKDENGVYHAYVDGKNDVLKVSSSATGSVSYKVTRMDTNVETTVGADGTYKIPEFEGSLMFKIDGIQDIAGSTAQDTTSVFLLVSVDKTAPVLTLSAPIFYADPDSGKYTITGTADAGSEIIYNDDDEHSHPRVYAAGDGSFAISGTLKTNKSNSGVLALYAQDSAENKSASQVALITKQKQQSGGSSSGGGSSYSDYTIQASANAHGSISPSGTVKVRAGADQTFTITPDSGYTIADVKVDGKSIGAVSTYTFEKIKGSHTIEAEFAPEDGTEQAKVKELTESILLKARSVKTAQKNIKVRLEMNKESAAAIQELQALGYTVKYKFYRSEKKARQYKAKLTKSSKVYVNTQGEKGRRYYYKARVMIYDQNGKLVDSSKLTQCRYAARIWTK